jgi:hypothetical protein
MQFPTAPIWLPHKGKAGVFLTALRVRRRPVEDRASARKHGGSASGIPLPGSENFLAVNINGAPAPFILPGLRKFSHPMPCAPEVLGWLRGVHPRRRRGSDYVAPKNASLCSERQRVIAGGWKLPLIPLGRWIFTAGNQLKLRCPCIRTLQEKH